MGVRDRLENVAAWFGFGVDRDDYYEEEEEGRAFASDRYATGNAPEADSGPTVRRLGWAERSSAFGTSLGDLFGSEAGSRDRSYNAGTGSPSHLRAVPDQQRAPQ